MAAFARPAPIFPATCFAVMPSAASMMEPSGSVILTIRQSDKAIAGSQYLSIVAILTRQRQLSSDFAARRKSKTNTTEISLALGL
jgi:hypothetical protein